MRTLCPFEYFEPTTVSDAVGLLTAYGEKSRILAGGVDLIPKIRAGKMKPDHLISIQKIPGLDYIQEAGKAGLKFGALARLHSLENFEGIKKNYPSLQAAIHQISSVQTKYMGTAVGNLCVATPASDVATALLMLGAELTVSGASGGRTIPIEGFFLENNRTSLQRGELVTGVNLPHPPHGMRTAFLNLFRTHSDVAKVSVAVAVIVEGGLCREARVAIGAVAPTVFRAVHSEERLAGQKLDSKVIREAAKIAAGETTPITDMRSTADYRKSMSEMLVRKALEKALEPAKA
jgi:carbon-monoxide dehydrogenase medium subunit